MFVFDFGELNKHALLSLANTNMSYTNPNFMGLLYLICLCSLMAGKKSEEKCRRNWARQTGFCLEKCLAVSQYYFLQNHIHYHQQINSREHRTQDSSG